MPETKRFARLPRWILVCPLFFAAFVAGILGGEPAVSRSHDHSTATPAPKTATSRGAYATFNDAPTSQVAPASQAADMFCGPRCVQFVLAHFGRQEELYDLIEEIQERDWRRGSSLASIDRALRRRGLHTAALRISDEAIIRCQEPAIVHLRGRAPSDLGHFVVQIPSCARDETSFWCGLSGVQTLPLAEACAARSGAVLLTSATKIVSPSSALIQRRERVATAALTLIAVGLAVGGMCFVCVLTKKGRKTI